MIGHQEDLLLQGVLGLQGDPDPDLDLDHFPDPPEDASFPGQDQDHGLEGSHHLEADLSVLDTGHHPEDVLVLPLEDHGQDLKEDFLQRGHLSEGRAQKAVNLSLDHLYKKESLLLEGNLDPDHFLDQKGSCLL